MSLPVRVAVCLAAAIVPFAAGGCGSASFVGRRYDNFTSYYNTFYNAGQSYEDGVRAMESAGAPIDRMRYLPIFGGPPRSGGNVNFQNAIEKSTDILIDHPRSKWVDDALMLIGQSYFYQENYVGAEQKFREVIAFESSLEEEARIWLARTLMAARSYEAAERHLASSLEREDAPRRSSAQLRLALGELFVKQGDFDKAATEIGAALQDVRNKELRAKGAFLLGQAYETLERYEDAVEAYGQALRARPPYELDYAASLNRVRVQGVHLDAAAALESLRRMDRDDKHYDRRAELAYVRGRIYHAQGLSYDALDAYRRILYEEENRDQTVRGLTHYALAELHRDIFRDYLLASAHFDTARTALSSFSSSAGSAAQYAPEAVTDAARQSEVFADFAVARVNIDRMDSLLALGRLDDEAFDERIRALQEQKVREMEEERRREEQLQAERGFRDAASRTGATGAVGSSSAANAGEAGFLYHRDRMRVQEARLNFVARWGERPHVPGWRRMEAVSLVLSAREESEAGGEADASEGGMDDMDLFALPFIDVSDVPRDSLSQAEMEEERALARYELGNVLFLSMNKADSAAVWYRMAIEQDADAEVAQRAFYALAEVQRSLGDTVRARGIYRQVLADYPDSDFAARVRMELGLEPEETLDSLAAAQQEYDEAALLWKDKAYEDALHRMLLIASRYRDTEAAAKALFAAGRIYFEWADADSLDVFGPLPIALPDSALIRAGVLRPAPDTLAAEAALSEAPETVPQGSAETGLAPSEGVSDGGDGAPQDAPDSALLASAVVDIVDLRSVYAGVRDLYPDTPYAGRAEDIIQALDEERQALQDSLVAADSLAVPAVSDSLHFSADSLAAAALPDSLAMPADSLAAPTVPDFMIAEQVGDIPSEAVDTLAAAGEALAPPEETLPVLEEFPGPPDENPAFFDEFPVPPDETLPSSGETPALSAIPSGEFSLYGPGGVQPALGGFAIAIDAHVEREPMEALVAPYAQQGLRAAVVVDYADDSVVYLAVIGHFSSEEAAETGLQGIRYMLGDMAQLARIVPLNVP